MEKQGCRTPRLWHSRSRRQERQRHDGTFLPRRGSPGMIYVTSLNEEDAFLSCLVRPGPVGCQKLARHLRTVVGATAAEPRYNPAILPEPLRLGPTALSPPRASPSMPCGALSGPALGTYRNRGKHVPRNIRTSEYRAALRAGRGRGRGKVRLVDHYGRGGSTPGPGTRQVAPLQPPQRPLDILPKAPTVPNMTPSSA